MIVYLEHHPYHRSCWITFVGVKPPQRESHLLFAIVVSAFFSTAGVPVHLWHTFFKTKLPFLHLDQWLLLITAAAPSMSSRIGTLEQSWSQTVNAEKFQGLPESSNDVSEFGKAEQSLEVIKFYKCWAYYQLSISSTFFLPRFSPSRPLNIEMNPVLSSNDLLEQLEEFRSQVIVAQYCLIALGIVGALLSISACYRVGWIDIARHGSGMLSTIYMRMSLYFQGPSFRWRMPSISSPGWCLLNGANSTFDAELYNKGHNIRYPLCKHIVRRYVDPAVFEH